MTEGVTGRKALCGATEKKWAEKSVDILIAIGFAKQLVIAQWAIPDKTNEIAVLRRLL